MESEKSEIKGVLDDLRVKHARERGERLKEERKRLGLNKIEFAALLGIHRNTQGNYETGREPPTDYLAAAQGVGVDIAYVMEGERMNGVPGRCSWVVETIFKTASAHGLCALNYRALAFLAHMLAAGKEAEYAGPSSGLKSEQIVSLVGAAFKAPDEFAEAVAAAFSYRHLASESDPTPTEEAAFILDTLSAYERMRDQLHLGLHDGIRLVAESIIRSRSKRE